MVYVLRRHNRFSARVRIPKAAIHLYEGREFLQRALLTSDLRAAKAEAVAWEADLRLGWEAATAAPEEGSYRRVYLDARKKAAGGAYEVHIANEDPVIAGIDFEIDRMANEIGERILTPLEEARLAGLNSAKLELERGDAPVPPEYEAPFSEAVDAFMAHWKTKTTRKEANTEKQLRATFKLFQGYWKDKPMRGITGRDAVRFHDALRSLNPRWASTPANRELSWEALIATCGGDPVGLSAATMNRHRSALGQLWAYAKRRGYCSGDDPFEGDHQRLEPSSIRGYQAWTADELKKLFDPPPKRRDLQEVMLVALYSGMRLNEIASLTWDNLRREHDVNYFQIEDAKTPAGNRVVPVHSALSWLVDRKNDDSEGRIWPTFKLEGPGLKPGGDVGKLFTTLKQARGFADRRKAFHSFRKNVVGQLEEKGVPENEVAMLVGHAKQGFTFKTYGAKALALGRLSEIVAMIEYPGLPLPDTLRTA
ncbi:MAG: tyrosine-type recombinase/integrase [Sphingomonadaceae bacterium]